MGMQAWKTDVCRAREGLPSSVGNGYTREKEKPSMPPPPYDDAKLEKRSLAGVGGGWIMSTVFQRARGRVQPIQRGD